MRITFNPAVVNTAQIKPIKRIVRRDRSLSSDPVEQEMERAHHSVQSHISNLGLMKSKQDVDDEKPYTKNSIWNVMLNI